MNCETFLLTKNEREVMALLWIQDRPLCRAEIIELSPERSWKASSIHIILNQLLEKGAIVVDGFVKTGTHYGRTFAAALSEDDYQVMQFKSGVSYGRFKATSIGKFVSRLIKDEALDEQTLDYLDSLLESKRRELK